MSLFSMAQAQTMSGPNKMLLSGATALVASTLMLISGCTEPRGELAGCSTDAQCKGERVCSSQGDCVSPLALPEPGERDASTDAGGGDDTGPSQPDTGNTDTGPDTTGPDTCDSAPTARIAGSATPVEAEPGATVTLDASASSAVQGQIDRYQWSVVDHPYSSSLNHLKPSLDRQTGGRVSFVANIVGDYVIDLTVVDDAGTESCNTVRAQITVAPDSDIFVELVWDTPDDDDQTDDDGADMDLHYKHPDGDWGYEPLDIFWFNPTADWGEPNSRRDDPELIRDDENGSGPESIAHNRPEDLHYAIGVYYYDDYGYGASEATVRVYLDGDLAHEVSAESLPGADTFYEAVSIDADEETVAVDDVHYDGYPPTN
jgi:hypothetical protein